LFIFIEIKGVVRLKMFSIHLIDQLLLQLILKRCLLSDFGI